jgi:hypothetical protein
VWVKYWADVDLFVYILVTIGPTNITIEILVILRYGTFITNYERLQLIEVRLNIVIRLHYALYIFDCVACSHRANSIYTHNNL